MSPRSGRASIAVQAALLLAPLVLALGLDDAFYRDSIVQVLYWAVLAGAWNVLGGFARQLSVGHVAFFGIGAYTSTLLHLHLGLSPWIGMLAGGVVAAAIAVGLGVVTFQLRGPFFSLATIAFAEVARILAVNWRSLTKGSEGLSIPSTPSLPGFVFGDLLGYVVTGWLFMVGVYAIEVGITQSKFGLRLQAFREEEDAARALGIATFRLRLEATALSALLTAMAGTFYAQYLLFIDPDSVLGVAVSLQMALLAVVGGIGTPIGPVLGAYLVVPFGLVLRAELGATFRGFHLVVYGVGLILVLYYLPEGLWPALERLAGRFRRPSAPAAGERAFPRAAGGA